ncbi:hypothetical protein Tco_1424729 [Tanacetum coccineum]
MKIKNKSVKRKSPCNDGVQWEPITIPKKQHFELTGAFSNTNGGEAPHSDTKIAPQPMTTSWSSNITGATSSISQEHNNHEVSYYHRLNNRPISNWPVLFDTDIGQSSSAKSLNMDYADAVSQHSILAADSPTHVECSSKCMLPMYSLHS